MQDEILFERRGRVALVTLNRPARLNAFSARTTRTLFALLARIAGDEGLRAVVLTGAGRAFCAGADLKSLAGLDGARDDDWGSRRGMIDLPLRLRALPQPTICAINGVAAGAGFGIALGADLRVASDAAELVAAQIKTARIPDAGLTYFLPRLLGTERALRILLSGRGIAAPEALALGLVGDVVPGAELLERALGLAEDLARGPSLATRITREAVYHGAGADLESALEFEYAGLVRASAHPDVEEGTRAFLERRPPRFA